MNASLIRAGLAKVIQRKTHSVSYNIAETKLCIALARFRFRALLVVAIRNSLRSWKRSKPQRSVSVWVYGALARRRISRRRRRKRIVAVVVEENQRLRLARGARVHQSPPQNEQATAAAANRIPQCYFVGFDDRYSIMNFCFEHFDEPLRKFILLSHLQLAHSIIFCIYLIRKAREYFKGDAQQLKHANMEQTIANHRKSFYFMQTKEKMTVFFSFGFIKRIELRKHLRRNQPYSASEWSSPSWRESSPANERY